MSGVISEYDLVDGMFVRKDTQDVTKIVDSNKLERESGENQSRTANARKVATIPVVVLEALKTRPHADGGPIDINLVGSDPDHTVRFIRWLEDRDNRHFRTSEARLGNANRYL